MAKPDPAKSYRKVQVETAAKDDLLVLLLDGGVRFAEGGLLELQKGKEADPAVRTDKLVRAQKILLELMGALSPAIGLELYNQLQDLYRFTFQRLFEGNIKGDETTVEEGVQLMKKIRDMWTEAVKKAREERNDGPQKPPPNSTLSVQG